MSKFGGFGGAFQSRINRFYNHDAVRDFKKEAVAEDVGKDTVEKTLRDVFSEGERTRVPKSIPRAPMGILPQQPTAQAPLQDALQEKQEVFSGTPSTKQKVLGVA